MTSSALIPQVEANPYFATVVGAQADDGLAAIVGKIAQERFYVFDSFARVGELRQKLLNDARLGSKKMLAVVVLRSFARESWVDGEIRELLALRPDSAHIVVYAGEMVTSGELAVRCLDAGAVDYVVYGSYDGELKPRFQNALSTKVFAQAAELLRKVNVFVITPFTPEALDDYESGICTALSGWVGECRLARDIYRANFLAAKIWGEIKDHDIIIANISDYNIPANANVFYEIAYAHGIGKKVAFVRKENRGFRRSEITVPTDIQGLEFIPYVDPADLAVQLRKKLPEWVNS